MPGSNYGVNLVTIGRGQHAYPDEWTSGGVAGSVAVPQVQTVEVQSDVPSTINGTPHYSGLIRWYDPTNPGSPFDPEANQRVWAVPRNSGVLTSGAKLEGQFGGYSASGPVAPVYLVSPPAGGGGAIDHNYFRMCAQGQYLSGNVERWYTSDTGTTQIFPAGLMFSGVISLIPFITPAGGRPDAMGSYVFAVAESGRTLHYAIYEREDVTKGGVGNNLPGKKVWENDESLGLKCLPRRIVSQVDYEFKENELYWLAHYSTSVLETRTCEDAKMFPVLGVEPVAFEQSCAALQVARAFLVSGGMPSEDVFPDDFSGALFQGNITCDGTLPQVAIRYPCSGPEVAIDPCCCEPIPREWRLRVGPVYGGAVPQNSGNFLICLGPNPQLPPTAKGCGNAYSGDFKLVLATGPCSLRWDAYGEPPRPTLSGSLFSGMRLNCGLGRGGGSIGWFELECQCGGSLQPTVYMCNGCLGESIVYTLAPGVRFDCLGVNVLPIYSGLITGSDKVCLQSSGYASGFYYHGVGDNCSIARGDCFWPPQVVLEPWVDGDDS